MRDKKEKADKKDKSDKADKKEKKDKSDKKEKKDKKRKRDGDDAEADAAPAETTTTSSEPTEAAPAEAKPPKRPKGSKKANAAKLAAGVTTLSADVFADPTLSDAAKKGIAYAQAFKAKETSGWKFQKAKQGWLLRNVFSSAEVTDAYVDVVVAYLVTVVGGARAVSLLFGRIGRALTF